MQAFSKIRELSELVDQLFQRAFELGFDHASLAAKAGLCQETVRRLSVEETQYPRLQTVHAIARAVGMKLILQSPAKARKAG